MGGQYNNIYILTFYGVFFDVLAGMQFIRNHTINCAHLSLTRKPQCKLFRANGLFSTREFFKSSEFFSELLRPPIFSFKCSWKWISPMYLTKTITGVIKQRYKWMWKTIFVPPRENILGNLAGASVIFEVGSQFYCCECYFLVNYLHLERSVSRKFL